MLHGESGLNEVAKLAEKSLKGLFLLFSNLLYFMYNLLFYFDFLYVPIELNIFYSLLQDRFV